MKILIAAGPDKDLTFQYCQKLRSEGKDFDILSIYGDTFYKAHTYTETLIPHSYDEVWVLPGCPFPERQLSRLGKVIQKSYLQEEKDEGRESTEAEGTTKRYDRVFKPRRKSSRGRTQVKDTDDNDLLPF